MMGWGGEIGVDRSEPFFQGAEKNHRNVAPLLLTALRFCMIVPHPENWACCGKETLPWHHRRDRCAHVVQVKRLQLNEKLFAQR